MAPFSAQRAPDLESFLSFWMDAGVDVCMADAPIDRRAPRTLAAAPARPSVRAGTGAPAPDGPDLGEALIQARSFAGAASTLEALADAIDGFSGCPLRNEGAKRTVTWRGARSPRLVVIGEAPGADEDAAGLPFVGRAGKLLDRMLSAAGLMDGALISNTVFWRPPGNRTPTPAEQAVCAPFVERLLWLTRPEVLLLVGGASAKGVLGVNEGILSIRGRWFSWTGAEADLAIPAMPTLHPAFLLRQPAAKARVWRDLLEIAARLDPAISSVQTET